jgi:hypothetical protein
MEVVRSSETYGNFYEINDFTSQKIKLFAFTAVRTSAPINYIKFGSYRSSSSLSSLSSSWSSSLANQPFLNRKLPEKILPDF